jgi:hypothetical protein
VRSAMVWKINHFACYLRTLSCSSKRHSAPQDVRLSGCVPQSQSTISALTNETWDAAPALRFNQGSC